MPELRRAGLQLNRLTELLNAGNEQGNSTNGCWTTQINGKIPLMTLKAAPHLNFIRTYVKERGSNECS